MSRAPGANLITGLVWPLTADITTAFSTVGPALWTFGSAEAHGFYEKTLLDAAAMAGLVTVTRRRETARIPPLRPMPGQPEPTSAE